MIVAYLLANLSYYFVLPSSVIESSNTVAVAFGSEAYGPIGAFLLAVTVAGSSFGALNATTFTGSRLVYAAAKEGYLPALFGRTGLGARRSVRSLHRTAASRPSRAARAMHALFADDDAGYFFTPVNAMLLNASLAAAYIAVGEFGTLLTFYGVAGYTFYFLTVLGLIVLRVREPLLERPYRTWLATPIVFCCVSLFLVSRAAFADPLQTLLVVGFTVAGVPVYLWRVAGRGRREGGAGGGGGAGEKGAAWWEFWRRWRR